MIHDPLDPHPGEVWIGSWWRYPRVLIRRVNPPWHVVADDHDVFLLFRRIHPKWDPIARGSEVERVSLYRWRRHISRKVTSLRFLGWVHEDRLGEAPEIVDQPPRPASLP